jgi:hypothetical protein
MSFIQQIKRAYSGCLSMLAMVVAILLIGSLVIPFLSITTEKDQRYKGISNCRQIITAMKIFASDHDGKYPDAFLKNPRNSNEVFRELFKEGILDDEMILGCPVSPFVPDGNFGGAPDFKQAVEAGENHWAMTAGLLDKDSGSIPLVYENPVVASWPPKWNANATGTETRGRAGSFGIVIGMNDGGAVMQPLEPKTGTAVDPKELGEGKNIFSQHDDSGPPDRWRILDVEVKP